MVRSEFPSVRLIAHDDSRGVVIRRNEGNTLASGAVVFSIDDDAEFGSQRVVEQTLREFSGPEVGAVAIPYIEPHKDNRVLQRAPDEVGTWVTDCYIGTAHAVRRDAFLRAGLYREALFHQGEERDFCIRLLLTGMFVRLGTADPILHHESPKRDTRRMDYYGRRNDILFAWHYVPMPLLLPHLVGTTIFGIKSMWRPRRARWMLQGIVAGYLGCLRQGALRVPVPASLYRFHRRLKGSGARQLAEVIGQLPDCGGRGGELQPPESHAGAEAQ
jgi:GT2 family glycosyltransferase